MVVRIPILLHNLGDNMEMSAVINLKNSISTNLLQHQNMTVQNLYIFEAIKVASILNSGEGREIDETNITVSRY